MNSNACPVVRILLLSCILLIGPVPLLAGPASWMLAGLPDLTILNSVGDSTQSPGQTTIQPQNQKVGRGKPKTKTEIELRSDNDMYLLNWQDQYYTNGLFINIRKIFDKAKLRPAETNRVMQFTLGHEMYNAYTAQIDSIQAVDRPIAAHLFVSGSVRHYYKKEQLFGYSLSVGTIGKRAMGKDLQAGLHNLFNMYHAAGWEFQLNNAWGANLSAEYLVLAGRSKGSWVDFSFHSKLTLGTMQTNVKAGPIIRLGKLNPFAQSAHFGARLQSRDKRPDREWYLYYQPEANLVFFDASLQGGLFLKDKGPVTAVPERWLLSNHFGGIYASGPSTFRIEYFFNTKESPQSRFRHQYGSLSFAYRF